MFVRCLRSLTLLGLFAGTALADGPTYKLDGNNVVPPSPVVYETGKAKLTVESDAALASIRSFLDDKSYVSTLRIEVHSDNTGKAAANQTLTEQRALAVARALVARGIDCKRLLPVGFGDTKPVAENGTAEGRAQNRRTTFVNAALRGRPIGGMPIDGGGKVAGDPCAK